MKVKNKRECRPECCGTCGHLKSYGLGGVKCKLEDGSMYGREDLVDVHYYICDEYYLAKKDD